MCCRGEHGDTRRTVPGRWPGFWFGLWHGLISPIAFVVSLFNSNVGIYEIHNNDSWFNFGFLLGVWILFHGAAWSGAAARPRRRRART